MRPECASKPTIGEEKAIFTKQDLGSGPSMGILRYEANLVQAVLFEKTNPTPRAVPDILRSHEVGLRFEAKE